MGHSLGKVEASRYVGTSWLERSCRQSQGMAPLRSKNLFPKMIYVKHYRSPTVGNNCYSILFRQTSMETPNLVRKAIFARRFEFRANETFHHLTAFEV